MICFSKIPWNKFDSYVERDEYGNSSGSRSRQSLSAEEVSGWERGELEKWKNVRVLYCPVLWRRIIWGEVDMPERSLPSVMICHLAQREKTALAVTVFRRYSWLQYQSFSRELLLCCSELPMELFELLWSWVEGMMRELDQPISVTTGVKKNFGWGDIRANAFECKTKNDRASSHRSFSNEWEVFGIM